MTIDKISIVTVCYNAASVIERTMLSVLEQSYSEIEYIIVDGMSTDNTLDIVKRVIRNFPNRMVKIISEPDKGIYDAMNKGIRASTGEWIHMLNAGDAYSDKNVLTNIFQIKFPERIKVIYSDFYTCINGVLIRGSINLKTKPSFNHQCTIYRRSLHEKHGYYIVTKPIIISDILFFYSIPTDEMMKTDVVIASYDYAGVSSQGCWSIQQWLCADVVFRRRSFWNMIARYVYVRTVVILTPKRFRMWLKTVFKFA